MSDVTDFSEPSFDEALADELPGELPGGLDTGLAAGLGADTAPPGGDLSLVHDVPVEVAVEIGRTSMTIREALAIAPGTIVPLNRTAGEPIDLLVNGRRIARGEVVAIDEEFGLRVTEIVSPDAAFE